MNSFAGKAIRWAALILLAMTAAFNILGGIGTTCAAFLTEQFDSMAAILDYQWLYQVFVVTTLAIGLAGAWVVMGLGKGRRHANRQALIVLLIGTALAAGHYYASLSLRGKAAPANIKFYLNLLTLVVFALLLIPGLRRKAGFDDPSSSTPESGAPAMAAILVGALVLTTSMWAGSSHTLEGANWVERLSTPLHLSGAGLILGGLGSCLRSLARRVPYVRKVGLGSKSIQMR